MSSFISSLINRHTLKSDIVKPRLMTLFESESLNRNAADINGSNIDVFGVEQTQNKPILKNTSIRDLKGDDIPDAPLNTISPTTRAKNVGKEPEAVEATKPNPFVKFKPAEEDRQPKQVNAFAKEPEITDPYFPVENKVKVTTGKSDITTVKAVNDLTAFPNRNTKEKIDAPQPINTYSKQEEAEPESMQRSAILNDNIYSQSAYFTKTLPLKDTLHPEVKKPSIKVTIGQIDVKAIPDMQPARIKNKTTEAPRMSLDDYLKMRNSN
ncbi:hypothetical protein [Mucilaginibacter sp.]|uniref:hypothetical protein n=1 Tax=Mucilaginibacter sp. TaxID=1882438 RepID=UPI002625F9CB|nr:hypothetical protein [Mucilaginibacter sp.]MDB5127218.1 hypothetical protein [Mucilaginibacter sp.]